MPGYQPHAPTAPPVPVAPAPSPHRDPDAGNGDSSTPPLLWRIYAALTAYLGLPVIAGWIAVTIAAAVLLPTFGAGSGFGLVQFVPDNTAAYRSQATEQRLFGSSLSDSQAMVVEHDPRGLSSATLLQIEHQTQVVDGSHAATTAPDKPDFALPLVNVPGVLSATRQPATTVVTFLFFPDAAQSGDITGGAEHYAASAPRPPGASVGVTGPLPAQISEGDLIENALLALELVTVRRHRAAGRPDLQVADRTGGAAGRRRSRLPRDQPCPRLGRADAAPADSVPARADHDCPDPRRGDRLLGLHVDGNAREAGSRRAANAGAAPCAVARCPAGDRGCADGCRRAPSRSSARISISFTPSDPEWLSPSSISGLVSVSFVPALVGVLGRAAFWPSLPQRRASRARASRRCGRGSARYGAAAQPALGGCRRHRAVQRGAAARRERTRSCTSWHKRGQRTAVHERAPSGSRCCVGRLRTRDRRTRDAAPPRSGRCPADSVACTSRGHDQVRSRRGGRRRTRRVAVGSRCLRLRHREWRRGPSLRRVSRRSVRRCSHRLIHGVGQQGHARASCGRSRTGDGIVVRRNAHRGGGGLGNRDGHLARRALRGRAHEPRAHGLFPSNPRTVAADRIECPRSRSVTRLVRRCLPGPARIPRRHLLRAGDRRIAAGVARRRLQRVRDGPHLGGGPRSRHARAPSRLRCHGLPERFRSPR